MIGRKVWSSVSLISIRQHTSAYVSIREHVLILLYMCPHTTKYVSSYYYMHQSPSSGKTRPPRMNATRLVRQRGGVTAAVEEEEQEEQEE
jgi:hypothetical protein